MERRRLFFLLVWFVAAAPCAAAEIEDRVDLFATGDRVTAVADGRSFAAELRPGERVIRSCARGYLGAVLSDARFFVLAATGGGWRELPLSPDEAPESEVFLSPYLALLVTGSRAVGFDAAGERFVEVPLGVREKLEIAAAEERVALVVTSSRALALAGGGERFAEMPLRARERVQEVRTGAGKATVRTSARLLSFTAQSGAWNEYGLH